MQRNGLLAVELVTGHEGLELHFGHSICQATSNVGIYSCTSANEDVAVPAQIAP